MISPDDSCSRLAELEGVRFDKLALRPDNYRSVLTPLIAGGFVVNLSVDVSSLVMMNCAANSTPCTSTPASSPGPAAMSMPASRSRDAPTTHCATKCAGLRRTRGGAPRSWRGANPGMVSHLFKRALVHLAADMGHTVAPTTREGRARLWRPA